VSSSPSCNGQDNPFGFGLHKASTWTPIFAPKPDSEGTFRLAIIEWVCPNCNELIGYGNVSRCHKCGLHVKEGPVIKEERPRAQRLRHWAEFGKKFQEKQHGMGHVTADRPPAHKPASAPERSHKTTHRFMR